MLRSKHSGYWTVWVWYDNAIIHRPCTLKRRAKCVIYFSCRDQSAWQFLYSGVHAYCLYWKKVEFSATSVSLTASAWRRLPAASDYVKIFDVIHKTGNTQLITRLPEEDWATAISSLTSTKKLEKIERVVLKIWSRTDKQSYTHALARTHTPTHTHARTHVRTIVK